MATTATNPSLKATAVDASVAQRVDPKTERGERDHGRRSDHERHRAQEDESFQVCRHAEREARGEALGGVRQRFQEGDARVQSEVDFLADGKAPTRQ